MDEELSMDDSNQLLDSASDFAYHPGVQNDAAAKKFLDRFPLSVILNTLQTKPDVPGLEDTLVVCLERIFKTKYGASLIPHYMPFVQVGLTADSHSVKRLACKTVTCLLEDSDLEASCALQLLIDYEIYPLLLDCLINGNEEVATGSMDAIKKLAGFPNGIDIIFPADNKAATDLGNLVAQCSSLLAEIQHSAEFLSRTTLLQLLCSLIGNSATETILRSRAIMISGRFLSKDDSHMFIDESSAKTVISAIDGRLGFLQSQDSDECESALEALGQIGSSIQGATLLLLCLPPAARHVIDAAFDRQGHGKQLAALHGLANIAGKTRSEDKIILNADAEESLRHLIYEVASRSSKLTPSGLFLSVLQQAAEIRLAGYRMITGLVARPWCLMELCSKQEIINTVTDASTEATKIGMEARYNCCKAIRKAFVSSDLVSDPAFAGIGEKLDEAVRRGPYLARKSVEAQPVVMTEQRF
ncbi:ARM repeat superfamily protein [Citrus sinensis]|uniref:ARM repeat superfamily protein n=1 Tax=Citrus sinensis TaxID=2711 RepID=A0ACB8NX95_CITSI|nr:ARM repeat superfamily protein [Citrus sinensis]